MLDKLLMLGGSILSTFIVVGVIMLLTEAKYRINKLVKGGGD